MSLAQKEIYNKLSLVYSHLMKNIRYDLWAEYLYNISKKYVTKKALVLELGAGSGLLTEPFRKYYPHLIATDISSMMLKQMTFKNITAVCDMTRLPFKNKFDLVFCAFDSVNYLLTKNNLKMLFTEVERILTPSGIFLFDVSLEKNSFKHAKIPYSRGVYNGISYENKSEYNPSKRIHTNYFEITENLCTYREVHKQKIFQFETYFKICETTGLYAAHCYDAFSFSQGHSECDRIQFVLKKAKK